MDDMLEEALPLRDRLNLETARITWKALERYFAAGKVIHITPALDLIEVAACVSEDNARQVQAWLQAQQIAQLSDATAKQWVEENPDNLWAVVVAPWVLVQQRTA
ncbi:MAG: hypothetical protein RI964_3274 [Pseudomonadota bacterium]|jgi:hypothetical protein